MILYLIVSRNVARSSFSQRHLAAMLVLLLAAPAAFAASAGATCPAGTSLVDTFEDSAGASWSACEDLQQPGGSIALVPQQAGDIEWFSKGYEWYGAAPSGSDDDYYLDMNKSTAVNSKVDILAVKLLNQSGGITWDAVESAVPPIRSAGVRAFVGSRGSVADTTFNDAGEDAAGYGFPPALSFVFNLTNQAEGGTPFGIADKKGPKPSDYINKSAMAEGLVGGHLPIVVFYYPVAADSPYLPKDAKGSRYWTMVASGEPDMKGSTQQSVYFRYQQLECAGAQMKAPCHMVGTPQYWDTFWWTRAPGGGATNQSGPSSTASASVFYRSLLDNRRWWGEELEAEGMHSLSLPSKGTTTNGTWLVTQFRANIIKGMITWHDTWGPRYGVLPGYGIEMQNGFQDTHTGTAMGALESGAMPYAKGLIDHQWMNTVRYDGLINYRAEELAQSARMLTILALYFSYSGGDAALLLKHFDKAQAMAEWLMARREVSLQFGEEDPRHGIPGGTDEGDDYKVNYRHQLPTNQTHWYPAAAEAYRAFTELGEVWTAIGKGSGRADVSSHGAALLKLAPLLYHDLHASLNKTVNTTASPGHLCYPHRADGIGTYTGGWIHAFLDINMYLNISHACFKMAD